MGAGTFSPLRALRWTEIGAAGTESLMCALALSFSILGSRRRVTPHLHKDKPSSRVEVARRKLHGQNMRDTSDQSSAMPHGVPDELEPLVGRDRLWLGFCGYTGKRWKLV